MTRSLKKVCLLRIVLFLEQFVGVTPSMHIRTWCEKFVATDVSVAK